MRATKKQEQLTLALNLFEGRLLRQVLGELIKNYRCRPDEFDPKSREAWYSARGCATAGMSAAETEEWLANLREFKGASVQLLEDWAGQLAGGKLGQFQLQLRLSDAPILITALNDHRLLTAARHDIGQADMDLRSPAAIARLPAARQAALYEIHFLACFMEEVLHLLPNSGADWNDPDPGE